MEKILLILAILFSVNLLEAQDLNINDGLISYYPFDCNAKDFMNTNHGQTHGVVSVKDRFGNANSAYQFDGRDDYISVDNSPSLENIEDEVTLSFWFNTFSYYRKWAVIVAKSDSPKSNSEQFSFYYRSDGNIYFNGEVIAQKRIELNKWHHVALTYKNKQVDCYLDGIKIGNQIVDLGVVKNSLAIDIGRHIPGVTEFYHGVIDDLRIYDRRISEKNISALYNLESESPKHFIEQYTNTFNETWETKDEYESSLEYKTRVEEFRQEKELEFESTAIDLVADQINWNCGSKSYDADKEEFTLLFNKVEAFKISVPRNEAREFGDNFNDLEYLNPEFRIGNEPNLIVGCITVRNPVNGKEYTYGCQSETIENSENRITVKSKIVAVKIWDDQQEDGDIVSIFLNDVRIIKEISVTKNEFVFTIELNEGLNTFKLLAHNEGESPPNTAAILIDDGNDEYKRVLSSKQNEFAELKIVLE